MPHSVPTSRFSAALIFDLKILHRLAQLRSKLNSSSDIDFCLDIEQCIKNRLMNFLAVNNTLHHGYRYAVRQYYGVQRADTARAYYWLRFFCRLVDRQLSDPVTRAEEITLMFKTERKKMIDLHIESVRKIFSKMDRDDLDFERSFLENCLNKPLFHRVNLAQVLLDETQLKKFHSSAVSACDDILKLWHALNLPWAKSLQDMPETAFDMIEINEVMDFKIVPLNFLQDEGPDSDKTSLLYEAIQFGDQDLIKAVLIFAKHLDESIWRARAKPAIEMASLIEESIRLAIHHKQEYQVLFALKYHGDLIPAGSLSSAYNKCQLQPLAADECMNEQPQSEVDFVGLDQLYGDLNQSQGTQLQKALQDQAVLKSRLSKLGMEIELQILFSQIQEQETSQSDEKTAVDNTVPLKLDLSAISAGSGGVAEAASFSQSLVVSDSDDLDDFLSSSSDISCIEHQNVLYPLPTHNGGISPLYRHNNDEVCDAADDMDSDTADFELDNFCDLDTTAIDYVASRESKAGIAYTLLIEMIESEIKRLTEAFMGNNKAAKINHYLILIKQDLAKEQPISRFVRLCGLLKDSSSDLNQAMRTPRLIKQSKEKPTITMLHIDQAVTHLYDMTYSPFPCLGSVLCQQLCSINDVERDKGIDTLIAIVVQLDVKKQRDFVNALASPEMRFAIKDLTAEQFSTVLKSHISRAEPCDGWSKFLQNFFLSKDRAFGNFFYAPLIRFKVNNPSESMLINTMSAVSKMSQDFPLLDRVNSDGAGTYNGDYLRCYQTGDGKIHVITLRLEQKLTRSGQVDVVAMIKEVISNDFSYLSLGQPHTCSLLVLKPGGVRAATDVYLGKILKNRFIEIQQFIDLPHRQLTQTVESWWKKVSRYYESKELLSGLGYYLCGKYDAFTSTIDAKAALLVSITKRQAVEGLVRSCSQHSMASLSTTVSAPNAMLVNAQASWLSNAPGGIGPAAASALGKTLLRPD